MPAHRSFISSLRLTPLASAIAACLSLSAIPAQAAKITVDTLVDEVNTVNSNCTLREAVTAANTNTAVDNCTAGSGEDTIVFGAGLNGQTIILNSGQIDIADAANPLTIDASALASGITISGNNTSRVFGETQGQKLTLSNLVITAGRTTGNNEGGGCGNNPVITIKGATKSGGAICTEGDLELIDTTVSNSQTTGEFVNGGGFYAQGVTTLTRSTVSGNSTTGRGGDGGGFAANGFTTLNDSTVLNNTSRGTGGGFRALKGTALTNSSITGNSTTGDHADGGGFFALVEVSLNNSTVSDNKTTGNYALGGGFFSLYGANLTNSSITGNSTAGPNAKGGGFFVDNGSTIINNCIVLGNSTTGDNADGGGFDAGDMTLNNSTISGNSTTGDNAGGGGFDAIEVTLNNSTVSGNSTAGANANGGGFFASSLNTDAATLANSTITLNIASHANATGDGVFISSIQSISINSTILSGNGTNNLAISDESLQTTNLNIINSLFGDAASEINGTNTANQFSNTPDLAPLADNGCAIPAGAPGAAACVQTHSILATSLALDNGANPDSLDTDQRGTGFPRVINGQADIGAFELNPASTPNVALTITPGMTGSWFDDTNPGQGINVEVLSGNRFLVYWYSYDNGEPIWLTGVGTYSGKTATVEQLETFRGSQFGVNHDQNLVERSTFGSLTVTFRDCNSGTMTYNSVSGLGSGTINLNRLTAIPGLSCTNPAASNQNVALTTMPSMTGSWFDGTNPGQGINVEVLSGNRFLVYWYTYDNGEPIWLTGVGTYSGKTATVEQLESFRGSQFGVNHNQNLVRKSTFGSLTVTFSDCDNGTMVYDSVTGLGNGTINLNRLTTIPGLSCTNPTAQDK